MKTNALITQIAAVGLMATLAQGATLRYNGSGIWNQASNGPGTNGWGNNPNNPATVGSIPTTADTARINFGGNTVTVQSNVPTTGVVQIGTDENGNLVVASGGTLATTGEIRVGESNANVDNATLTVQNGGNLNVGGILWTSTNGATGNFTIANGGTVTVGNHLWWGINSASVISISGSLTQTAGILGLGTSNASTASGGTAMVSILNGGLLALNNISGTGTNSIQAGSAIDISGTGRLTAPGNRTGAFTTYIDADRITGNGMTGISNLNISYDSGMDLTTVTAVPEPSAALLLGIAGSLALVRRKT